jgi:nucleotide-binding universal stress UspA family protein
MWWRTRQAACTASSRTARSSPRAVERLDALVDRVRDAHPDLDVERRVVNDTGLRALLEQGRDARMIVVGHRDRASVVGRLGSTSRGLVEFAPCPVVVT